MAEGDQVAQNEPTLEDDGLSPEERAQFDAMSAGRDSEVPDPGAAPPPPEPAAGDPPPEPVAGDPPVADAADGDDDDEPVAGADPAPGADGKPRDRRVNYNKFQRAETARKTAETALAAERAERQKDRENQARLDERLRILNEALTTPKAPPKTQEEEDPEPDPEADIFGHNAWLKRQLVRTNERLNEVVEGRQRDTTDSSVATAYEQDAMTFARTEPNFRRAYKHLMQSRTVELAEVFFGKDLLAPNEPPMTPQQLARITQTIQNEERQIVAEALRSGTSPAARIFRLAKGRGFVAPAAGDPPPPPAPAAAKPGNGAANGNGGHAPPAPVKPSVSEEIERIRNGQDASLSLSNGGGSPGTPVLDPKRLADMPQHEFDALVDQMSDAEWRQAVEGRA